MGAGCVSSQLATIAPTVPSTGPRSTTYAAMAHLERRLEARARENDQGLRLSRPGRQARAAAYAARMLPIGPLLRVVCEFAGQSEWTFARDLDVPARERRRDCEPHRLTVESSGFGQPMDIEE